MTVLQLHGPMAFRVLQWCHPMPASIKEDKLLSPDDHLIWYPKVDLGPRKCPDMLFLLYFRAPVACNISSHSGTPTLIFFNMGLRSACAHGEVYTLLIASFYIHK